MLIPAISYYLVFKYEPMSGLVLAFKRYLANRGIWGSPWVNLKNFQRIFITPDAIGAIINTLEISIGRLIFEFPIPIMLALMVNEIRGRRIKRLYQTIYTFPHFLSWVVVGAMVTNMFANSGSINQVIALLGGERINFLASTDSFRPLLYVSANWKEAGWSAIIYMATITGLDPALYEAATVDGANRLQQTWYVTIPGISSTIVVLLILAVGRMMNAGFDQIFNLQNSAVKGVSEIIDTYIYNITFRTTPDYGFSTAVGMFKSVINFTMLLLANTLVKRISGKGLFA
jgi:putative aldouronate transport system permease protein